uniref:Double-stranded DNA-binding protein n=1 Tax=Candidatus Methanomethylicus mesodigestus TaxID=1867258 RepID=A0A7C3F218_9CREN
MASNDSDELEAIKRRKMIEFERRRAAAARQTETKESPKIDDLTLVRSRLTGRGQEVLDAAMAQYPKVANQVVRYIANLYRSGQLNEDIPGEDLYEVFQSLGLRVRLETTITYVKDGKRIPLSKKLTKDF